MPAWSDTDVLGIANQALVLIGQPPLASLSDNTDRAVIAISATFDDTIRALMDAHAWGFLAQYQELTLQDPTAGDPPWAKKKAAWQFPTVSTALWRIRRVEDGQGNVLTDGWEILGQSIFFRDAPTSAGLVYFGEEGVANWPPLFRKAAIATVGGDLAIAFSKPGLATAMYGLAQDYIDLARSMESQSTPTKTVGRARPGAT